MKRTWIKMWPKVLNDRRFMQMPDRLRVLAYELMLVAGHEGCEDGELPSAEDIDFYLRRHDLDADMVELERKWDGLHREGDRWYLVNWTKHQESPSASRTRQWRDREERHGDGHSDAQSDVQKTEDRRQKTEEEDREEEVVKTSAVASVPSSLLISPDDVVDSWNSFAPQHGLSVVRAITDKRKKAIKRRAPEVWPQIDTIYEIIRGSPFLLGENNRSWTVDFDFIWCTSDGALKILEGKYSNGTNTTTRKTSGRDNGVTLTELRRSSIEAAAILERSRQARADSDGAAGAVHRTPDVGGAQGWHRGNA